MKVFRLQIYIALENNIRTVTVAAIQGKVSESFLDMNIYLLKRGSVNKIKETIKTLEECIEKFGIK